MRALPPIRFREPSHAFRKMASGLAKSMRSELNKVIRELESAALTPGRKLKKVKTFEDLYYVRLSRSHRFVFALDAKFIGTALAVGTHKQALGTRLEKWRKKNRVN